MLINIIEAINKAKKFNRSVLATKSFSCGKESISPGLIDPDWLCGALSRIDRHSLLSDNWDVEEKVVSITSRKFWETYRMGLERFNTIQKIRNIDGYSVNEVSELVNYIAEELGVVDNATHL